jgi:acyl-CoA reductase-like NAD-dependent aldehyde dehydrogenase
MLTEHQTLCIGGEWTKPASLPYGLGGTVWSADSERAVRMARRVAGGTVGVNGYLPDLNAPFGGIKASGLGREMGPESLASFLQVKSIYLMG